MRILIKRHNFAPEEEELETLEGYEPFDFEGKQAFRATEYSNICNCINNGVIECAVVIFVIDDMSEEEISETVEFIDERSCMALTVEEMQQSNGRTAEV